MRCIPGHIKIEYFFNGTKKMAQILPPELFVLIFRYKYADPGMNMSRDDVNSIALLFKSITTPGLDIWRYVDQVVINYMDKYKISNKYYFESVNFGLRDYFILESISRGHYYYSYNFTYLFKKFVVCGAVNPAVVFPEGRYVSWNMVFRQMEIIHVHKNRDMHTDECHKYNFNFEVDSAHPGDAYDFIIYISKQLIDHVNGKKSNVIDQILQENDKSITKLFHDMYPRTN